MKEERLFYDPRSSVLLELVEEYIEHNLLVEAETLLKDYINSNPESEKALVLWLKIARLQKDEEKEKHLMERLKKIQEAKKEEVLSESFEEILEIKEEEKKEEIIKEKEEEEYAFLKGIPDVKEIKEDSELKAFLTFLTPYLQKWKMGEIEEVIVESESPVVGFKKDSDFKFVRFKENTNFVTLMWVIKKLKWNK